MAVPTPPAKLNPRIARWPAHQAFHRVFRLAYGATTFNPGGSGVQGRFHFFADAAGRVVPILYGADSEDAAIAETVLRDVRTGGVVFRSRLAGVALALLTPSRELALIELHGYGLKRLDLQPHDLTSTYPDEYGRTVAWAKALHAAAPAAEGMVWMSHRFNTSKALVLFGDRVDPSIFTASPPLPLGFDAGLSAVERCANEAGITII